MCDNAYSGKIWLICILLLASVRCSAQLSGAAGQLVPQVRQGTPLALRDFAACFSPDHADAKQIQLSLESAFKNRHSNYTRFENKQQFFDIYYPLRQILKFDHSLAAYYDPSWPDSLRASDFFVRQKEIQLPDFQQSADLALRGIEQADTSTFISGMLMLQVMPAQMQDTLILSLYKKYISLKTQHQSPIITACFDKYFAQQFTINTQPEAPLLLAQILDKGLLMPQVALQYYQQASGRVNRDINAPALRDSLLKWSKESKNPQAIRLAGYEHLSGSSRAFFDTEADFLGWMVIRMDTIAHLRTSILQMLGRSDDPRALFHLGSLVARIRWDLLNGNTAANIYARQMVQAIEQRTGMEIAVSDKNGASVTWAPDPVWLLHYGLYWEKHWNDYVWDVRKNRFSHKATTLPVEEEVALLFRKLASTNDSIAIHAYELLTSVEPGIVLKLLPEYTDLIRNPNPQIPPLKRGNLHAAVALRAWGKEIGLNRKLSAEVQFLVEQLRQESEVTQRLSLENQLIETTSIQDLMVLDIYLVNKTLSRDASYSFSRILDQLYTRHWQQIISNPVLTRVFLKKAIVFKQIQTTGTLHRYLNKFDLGQPWVVAKLKKLLINETDPDIQTALLALDDMTKSNAPPASKPPLLTEVALAENKRAILLSPEPDYHAINAITMSEQFSLVKDQDWLQQLIQKWPKPEMLRRIGLAQKLDPVGQANFFDHNIHDPEFLAEVWRWYSNGNFKFQFNALLKATAHQSPTVRGGWFFQFLRAEPVRQWLLTSGTEISDPDEVIRALSSWLDSQEYISEYDEADVKLILLLLEYANQSLGNKLAVTCALQGASQKALIQSALLATVQYVDLHSIADYFACIESDPSGEPLLLKTLRELGLPPVLMDKKMQSIKFDQPLLQTILTGLDQIDIRPYHNDSPNLNYGLIKSILEQERIIPWMGSGGDYRDWYVFSVIKLLEHKHQTTLGFHEKLNENQTFFSYNSAERAEAWLTFLRKHKLLPDQDYNGAKSWQ